jgi:hypothetical protein
MLILASILIMTRLTKHKITNSKERHTQQNSRPTTNIGRADPYQQIIQIKLNLTEQCALHDTSTSKSSK